MVPERNTKNPPLSTRPETGSVLRAAGTLGVATAASRVLGFARDWLIAVLYGTSLTAQAFVVAFRIPNLLRVLIGEGAANSVFVPVFSRIREREGNDSWMRLAQAVWVRLLIGAAAVSLIGIWVAPWAVRLIAPGFETDPALMALTVKLTRILFPFLGLVGVYAFLTGLLNSVRHFARPSLGPIVLNVCMITGILLWRQDAMGLVFGILAGGVLQIVIQRPALRRCGLELKLAMERHPAVSQIRKLLLPRMAGAAVYQGSVLVDTIFASFAAWVGPGGVAALYFANRFLQLPLALFGISLAQASLPAFSAQVASQQTAAVRSTFIETLRSTLFVAVPSTVGLMVMAQPIIQTLLEHGAFSSVSTQMTVAALSWYAVGLSSLCAAKVMINALYAFGDTWTPVRAAGIALSLNIILNLLLIRVMGLAGLALATSLSATWNALHLYRALRGKLGPLPAQMRGWAVKLMAAGAGMGILVWWIWGLTPAAGSTMPLARAGWLGLTIATGTAGFFGLSAILGIEESRRTIRWLFRRG